MVGEVRIRECRRARVLPLPLCRARRDFAIPRRKGLQGQAVAVLVQGGYDVFCGETVRWNGDGDAEGVLDAGEGGVGGGP